MVKFSQVLAALAREGQLLKAPENPPTSLSGVVDHTNRVVDGSLFCAIKGTVADGHAYIAQARERGARAFLVTNSQDAADEIVVADVRIATAIAASEYHGRPVDDLLMIGVTGTNGKSTTVSILQHLLNGDQDVAAVGTLGAFDGTGTAIYEEKLTTPGAAALHETLAMLRRRGTRTVVMEVSSHALDQNRLHGVTFSAGIFTNATRDHLDYHGTFEAYLATKMSLAGHISEAGWQVVNVDHVAWSALPLPSGQRRLRYGTRGAADVLATVKTVAHDGALFDLRYTLFAANDDEQTLELRSPLLGVFNVSNAVAASSAALALGLPPDILRRRLANVPQVPGRMEQIGSDGLLVLRDYAHTPDALERAIGAAREITTGRLIVLFGCGGDRDAGKRAPMGRIAVRGADVAVVTSDNPRTEDPEKIVNDVEEGMDGKAYLRIVDRREAIHRSVGMMQPNDCLLLAGKGHETYQVIGTERVPFDECEIVADAMQERKS